MALLKIPFSTRREGEAAGAAQLEDEGGIHLEDDREPEGFSGGDAGGVPEGVALIDEVRLELAGGSHQAPPCMEAVAVLSQLLDEAREEPEERPGRPARRRRLLLGSGLGGVLSAPLHEGHLADLVAFALEGLDE